ncbi:MAG: TraB/GumN family protein [Pseudoxanthomonas sp.]
MPLSSAIAARCSRCAPRLAALALWPLLAGMVQVAPPVAAPLPEQSVPPVPQEATPTASASPEAALVAAPASPATPPGVLPWRGVVFRVTAPASPVAQIEPVPAGPAQVAPPATAPAPAVSYVVGTIHFGTDAEHGLDPQQLDPLLARSTTLVNEVDVDATSDPALDPYRWLPADQDLGQWIAPSELEMAQSLLPQISADTLYRMKPWLMLALLEARGEQGGEQTLDVRVQRMADARGLRTVHLEQVADQMKALDCVPSDQQARVLSERLKAPWLLGEESARALSFYRDGNLWGWLGDVDRMFGLSADAKAIETQARGCLLEQRNAQWMPQLLALLSQGGCVVAVGAIHLPGDNGLLAALARAGYRVEAQPL